MKESPLPNPRAVSSRILERLEELDPRYNLMVMQWGQFIDHDFAMTPQYKAGWSTLIGPDHGALLCHKDTSKGTLLGLWDISDLSLVLYGIRVASMHGKNLL